MKKRMLFLSLFAFCLSLLVACSCEHNWIEATCDIPRTCSLCEEIEAPPLGHSWIAATCEAPKRCENCTAIEGDALGHSWMEATTQKPKTCGTCGKTEGAPLIVDFEDSIACVGIKSILRDSLSAFKPSFEFDDSGTFYVHLEAPEGTVMAILLSRNDIADSWESLIDSLRSISKDAAECFSADGYNVGCCIMLHNDMETDKIILSTYNGYVIVDIMEELK